MGRDTKKAVGPPFFDKRTYTQTHTSECFNSNKNKAIYKTSRNSIGLKWTSDSVNKLNLNAQ